MALSRVHVLPGDRFGLLTVIEELPDESRWGQSQHRCLVQCDCGAVREVYVPRLRQRSEPVRSCGAHKHRYTGKPSRPGYLVMQQPEYGIWAAMKRRCLNPNVPEYRLYGARGIRVCDRWRDSFWAFFDDVGQRPSPEHWIERKDNDGDYEPGNVIWATRREQHRNKRTTRWIEFDGERKALAAWAEQYGIDQTAVWKRLNRGWPISRALMEPLRRRASL